MRMSRTARRVPLLVWGLLALSLVVWGGCDGSPASEEEPAPDVDEATAWHYGTTYHVFVHSFADGNGDGIGDFEGLIQKLDYIDELGVESIWMLPVHPSPSYHKYDVTDYRAIHEDYGTMSDFERLLDEAEARDIKIIMDLVVNHTARDHPWFQQAVADTTSPYYDFYVWQDAEAVSETEVDAGPDTDNRQKWHAVEEIDDVQDGIDQQRYYGYFWGGMPDLNFDNPAVRDSIMAIGEYWLGKGVDGFRLDAAKHIFEDDRADDTKDWWREFRSEMEAEDPNVLLVGEVWDEAETVAPYFEGLHALFNFDLSSNIIEALQTGTGDSLAVDLADTRATYGDIAPSFIDATFLTNHDQPRILGELPDAAHMRTAAYLLFTLPGSPYVYYGEEIGMYGEKPDPNIREPMLWAPEDQDSLRTTWIEPEYSTDDTVTPVAVQNEKDDSLLNLYRELIHLRRDTEALRHGTLHPVTFEEMPEALSIYERRTDDGASLLVAHNVSAESIDVTLPDDLRMRYATVWHASDEAVQNIDDGASLPAATTIIWTDDPDSSTADASL